jgi:serine-type D-Ala-D-Ala carboxypeptidase/endopeptidase (penicillin-binding protein 4)
MWKNILILLLGSALAALLILRREAGAPAAPSMPPLSAAAPPTAPEPQPPVTPQPPATEPQPVQPTHRITKLLQDARANPALSGTAIGFCLLSDKGETVLDENATTAFIPASSLKTLTTATALEALGPDFHFITELKSSAVIEEGVIKGDLVVIGGGDPMLKMDDLKAWAVELKKRGLQRVTGGIRADTRFFSGSLYNDYWNWGDIGNGYGSGVSGLNLNHNRYIVMFRAGAAEGAPAELLGINLELPQTAWKNEVTTGPSDSGDGVVIHGGEIATAIHLRGTVPLGATRFQAKGAVPDPARFIEHHFRSLLAAEGIQVESRSTGAGPAAHPLLKHESPALIDIIKSIHATSDNLETECVFRMLGLKQGKPPAEVIREHWKQRGLDLTGLRMEDGCGLARADFIRPLDLARLQYFAAVGPQGAAYKSSLLSEGGLSWKGGAMSGVRSFTGYVKTKSGAEYFYALMMNHFTDGKAVSALSRQVMDAMQDL